MTSIAALPDSLQSLRWKHLFTLKLEVTAVQKIGSDPVIGVVSGGEFSGARLSGRVLEGGSDWQRITSDGAAHLDCRIVLETTQGALIAMTYQGVRSGPAEVLARLAKGEAVRAEEYYLRINPLFKTQSPEDEWLNRIVAVGTGQRLPTGPVYNVFEIL